MHPQHTPAIIHLSSEKMNWSERHVEVSHEILTVVSKFAGNKLFFQVLTLQSRHTESRGGRGGVLPEILDRGVPRRFLSPNPI